LCLYAPLMGFSPLGGINTDMPMGSFSAILRESKSSAMGFSPLGVPSLLQEFSLLRAPVWCFADGISLIRSTNTSLRAPLIRTYSRMNSRQFFSANSLHILRWDFPHSVAAIYYVGNTLARELPYFDDGISPTRESALLWDFPHTEINSTTAFTLTRGYQISILIYLGPQLRIDAFNLSLGDIPLQSPFFKVFQDHGYSWRMVYIWGFSCLDYPLDVLVLSDYRSNALRRKKMSGNTLIQLYTFLKFECLFRITWIVHTWSTATSDALHI